MRSEPISFRFNLEDARHTAALNYLNDAIENGYARADVIAEALIAAKEQSIASGIDVKGLATAISGSFHEQINGLVSQYKSDQGDVRLDVIIKELRATQRKIDGFIARSSNGAVMAAVEAEDAIDDNTVSNMFSVIKRHK